MKIYLLLTFLFIFNTKAEFNNILKCSNPSIIWNENKGYYLGIYFKANWFKAELFCRYHGMQLLSLSSQTELDYVIKLIKEFGIHPTHYWTSGNDLSETGNYFWSSTGRPIQKNSTLWLPNQPDNWKDNEHCVHLWDMFDYRLNDNPCTVQYNFICETTTCSNL